MPTGYTYAVGSGEVSTLRDFALRCARGMGACITMRDDALDKSIPERFVPSTEYHDERLVEARSLLSLTDSLSDAECSTRADADYAEAKSSFEKSVGEAKAENERYRSMLAHVNAWETEAEGIKSFMCQQLEVSISDYDYERDAPTLLTGSEWRVATRSRALRDIAYHEKGKAEEIERTERRNEWLQKLRDSLPPEVQP